MVFDHPEFDGHVRVIHIYDPATSLRAILAIHHLRDGRSGGGIRFRAYPNSEQAFIDVARLSRAMTYKFALADVPMGGAKLVISGDPSTLKTRALLETVGDFVAQQGGQYYCGPDVGTNVDDLRVIAERTKYVAGLTESTGEVTAEGVYNAIRALNTFLRGRDALDGTRIAVQGLGEVGGRLCELLAADGAKLLVADVNADAVRQVVERTGARAVPVDGILSADADLLAPCALGGVLNAQSIPLLRVKGICGAANNQLANADDGSRLLARGIAYVPDVVANAGGVITGSRQLGFITEAEARARLKAIGDLTLTVLERAAKEHVSTESTAIAIAKDRLQ